MKTLAVGIPLVAFTGIAGISNGEVRYAPNTSRSNGCFRDILKDC